MERTYYSYKEAVAAVTAAELLECEYTLVKSFTAGKNLLGQEVEENNWTLIIVSEGESDED